MIKPLTTARWAAAVSIFLHHAGFFPESNTMGVAFFFVLAGFFAARSLDGRSVRLDDFCKDKFARLWPLHLLTLCVAAIVGYKALAHTWWMLPINAALLQSWVPDPAVFWSFNGVSWYLSVTLLLTVLTPWLARTVASHRGLVWVGAAVAVVLGAMAVVPHPWQHWSFFINPAARLVDFAVGMSLFRVWKMAPRLSVGRATLVEVGTLAVVVAFVAIAPRVEWPWRLSVWWWVPMGLLIWVFASAEGWVSRAAGWRPLVWLGEISFSFYLIHQIIIKWLSEVAMSSWFRMGFALVLSVGLAAAAHYWFERPVARWIKKRWHDD